MANKITKKGILRGIFLFPIAFLFSILATILFLVFYVLQFIPFIIYRYFILILSKCIYPDSKMLPGLDNFIARGSVYKTKELYSVFIMVLEGKVGYDEIILDLNDKIIKKRLPNGKLRFPELQCYIETFMGYSFYRKDNKFDLRNHIKLYKGSDDGRIDKIKFHKIREEFSSTVFTKKLSPFDVLVVHNYEKENQEEGKEYSAVLVKIHHCLSDGFATVTALFGPFGEIPPLTAPRFGKNYVSRLLISIASFFHSLIMIGSVLFNMIYNPRKAFDLNSWQKLVKREDIDSALWSLEPMSTDVIKDISKANKVSVSSVLINACAGGFRRMMEAKGVQSPKNIRVGFTHHMPNHSLRLSNNSSGTFFNIPIANSKTNSAQKLKWTEKNMSIALAASFKFLTYIFFGMTKYFPGTTFRCGKSIRKSFLTMVFSTVPLPSFDIQWAGCNLLETYNNIECVDISVAVLATILKYKNRFFVTFAVQRTLLEEEDEICQIERYFHEELNFIKTNCGDNV